MYNLLIMTKDKSSDQNNLKIPQTASGFFWYVSKPHKWWMIGAIVTIVIAAAASQGTNYFIKLIVDAVEEGNSSLVFTYAILYPVSIFAVQGLYRISALFGRHWSSNSRKMAYDSIIEYTMNHSHSYFANRFAGSLMSKVSNIVNGIDSFIPDLLWIHINSLVSFLVTFFFIVIVSVPAAAVFIALVIVLFILNKYMAPEKAVLSRANADMKTELSGKVIDVFSNVQAVRQYSRQPEEQKEIFSITQRVRDAHFINWGYTEKMLFWNSSVLFVFGLAMFWLLALSWQAGEMGTGDFVLIISLFSQITGTLIFIGRAFNNTAQSIGEMREGLEDLLLPYEVKDVTGAKSIETNKASIEWSDVDFNFEKKVVFSGFNINIESGQKVGLVGESGAGKTTFVSLLLRQHNVDQGIISINGQDISAVTQNSLRREIAIVPQEPSLFHRSIRENILYGKPEATEEELIEVSKKAQAHDFIMELPEQYDTLVGERGVKLSGGQKQRVAIARAMLKDAPILILDEATSALDSDSEVAIQKALESLMEGRTVIAVAHRLSTLRKMDRIVVMDKGVIVEDGNHDSLLENNETYSRLWNHQTGGFVKN